MRDVKDMTRTMRLAALVVVLGLAPACNHDAGGGDGDGTDTAFCATEPEPEVDGEWDSDFEDWNDPGPQGKEVLYDIDDPMNPNVIDVCDSVTQDSVAAPSQIEAHHCFTTAVHAVHMRTGDILMHHGQDDERVWRIGEDPADIGWHPVPFNAPYEVWNGSSLEWDTVTNNTADLFCSGQAQLADGRVLIAGGNVTGRPGGGGLADTFLFDPNDASSATDPSPVCPFGWQIEDQSGTWTNLSPRMTYDRWYPTLTVLGDGRALISGGTSRVANHMPNPVTMHAVDDAQATRYLELYDPTSSPPTIVVLDNSEAMFPVEAGVPVYPFVFLLPNGDIFFAGAEEADGAQRNGYILVPDYGNVNNWEFSEHVITSTIPGGSAAMPRPGLIIKSGGGGAPAWTTELVDLRGFASGEYDNAPESFEVVDHMAQPRHYHTMTLLPDGRVLVTGGNRQGNAETDDHYENPCDYTGELLEDCEEVECSIDSLDCNNGCPSVCINWTANQSVDINCSTGAPDLTCSLIREVACAYDPDPMETADDEACDAILDGATCASQGYCTRSCSVEGDDCGLIQNCAVAGTGELCSPRNNACYATYSAEIWDPGCQTWTELGEEEYPRMYHSTALLLPDTRVLSMGGGHASFAWQILEEQVVAQYFAPDYAENPSAVAPNFGFGNGGGWVPNGNEPYLRWGAEGIDVYVNGNVTVDHASLIRLGSVTHGFNMDQRYLRLPITGGDGTQVHVAPAAEDFHSNTAPPGYYMLFLVSDEGEPSQGRYIRVGDETSPSFVCEVSTEFSASEYSCDEEPDQGECPMSGRVSTPVAPPLVEGPSSTVSGFRVVVPAGVVNDFENLTADEVSTVEGLCAQACTGYFASQLGQSANCTAAGVFETPVLVAAQADPSVERIPDDSRHGEGIFTGEQVSCDLGTGCYSAFDEALQMAVPVRVTPAQDMLGVGEEWNVTVSGTLDAVSSLAVSGTPAALTGTVGYSECTAGNASDPCPFYLGSMELELGEPLQLILSCNSSPYTFELEELTIRLAQPAFGIAKEGSTARGFPPGSLVLEAEGVVNSMPFTSRRPNQEAIMVNASSGSMSMQGSFEARVDLAIPCGTETAKIELLWDFSAAAVPGRPPTIEIDVPSTVSCPNPIDLDYTASDYNDDIQSVRWLVDRVLMSTSVTTLDFTDGHELTAIVRDARGATETDIETVACL